VVVVTAETAVEKAAAMVEVVADLDAEVLVVPASRIQSTV
jgi:hypothetical protein